jgi:choline kinase
MKIFLLGAGRPAHGKKPSALKTIALNTKALDWQINAFEKAFGKSIQIHFLGGYHVEEIARNYPSLDFSVIPDWEKHSVVHTLLKAPISEESILVSYSDTIFRPETLVKLISTGSDVAAAYDSNWIHRYSPRSEEDLRIAEKIHPSYFTDGEEPVSEFTGLVHFSSGASRHLMKLKESEAGSNLPQLLRHFKDIDFKVTLNDVAGQWAELNSPVDVSRFILGTKAETLDRLQPLVKHSHIGNQFRVTIALWRESEESVLSTIQERFPRMRLIIRSSAKGEDNWQTSNAGGFESILNVDGASIQSIREAIGAVADSYGRTRSDDDQILVQEFIQNVKSSGVVFSCGLDTGSSYYRINFDDKTQSTESVTSGTASQLRTIIVSKSHPEGVRKIDVSMIDVIEAVSELEELLSFDKLDVEFAIDSKDKVHIFQVRPVTVDHSSFELDASFVSQSLEDNKEFLESQKNPSPFIHGQAPMYGNMPDWNPAEIIGTKPKPLAFSLYRHLITNEIWAIQRAQYGYRDVRPCPLIVSFSGQPYVDVRASLNSFIPASLPENLAKKLADAYLDILEKAPHLNDKIEFDVAFTVWFPGFKQEVRKRLSNYPISEDEFNLMEESLRKLTLKAFTRLESDIQSIDLLNARRERISGIDLPPSDKAIYLLSDCKTYGTLAFSHAARAGFVASTFLKSFVKEGIMELRRVEEFMLSIKTVAKSFEEDKFLFETGDLDRQYVLKKYGHLRPGTYDVTTPAYWEDPEIYLFSSKPGKPAVDDGFVLSDQERTLISEMLIEMGSTISPEELLKFFTEAIQAREAVKLDFTKNLSLALDECVKLSVDLDITREDFAYLEYSDLELIKLNGISRRVLRERIQERKQAHTLTQLIELPTLITNSNDLFCFERHESQPNFVGTGKVESEVVPLAGHEKTALKGKIVLIPQADPGYDWLFGHDISGLITQYGGANSHMAIRSAEIGLAAAIGVGEKLYEELLQARRIELDCLNQLIRFVE